MARLASQAKGGWYPAPPEAVAAVLDRVCPPPLGDCTVLDPCAGQGAALLQIAEELEAEPFAVELAEDRSVILKALLEDDALSPCDFFRTSISARTFSMCFLNPPFDYATGNEGRVESQFLHRATGLLADGGLMCLVCPENVARSYNTRQYFEENFCQVSAMRFPQDVRKYQELVLMGLKRPMPATDVYPDYEWVDKKLEVVKVYVLPPGHRPRAWRKVEPTDAELSRLVAQSPLRFMLAPSTEKADWKPRPPLSLGTGHRALLLAAGHIDGLICPENEKPHVIRGTATKDKYVASQDVTEDNKGNVTTKTVISEKPRLVIRVLTADGEIVNLE